MSPSSKTLNKINEADPFAMHYWSRQFRLSERELRKAISEVGNSPQAVRQYARQATAQPRDSMQRHNG
ncbi:DUF3606 domain-containing protein [Dyella sp.]|jgi:hypothetical protein|uniref:DUF3606 domain-containing protein n=1 Tax=Dyella sp. TaxID=1869338 RepID=UPI002D7689C2|nr:DUF3606 domain-containing protein [Dyella sp.]HET6431493.1 DUF3606 domain-containing protein [Dyella sp.]